MTRPCAEEFDWDKILKKFLAKDGQNTRSWISNRQEGSSENWFIELFYNLNAG